MKVTIIPGACNTAPLQLTTGITQGIVDYGALLHCHYENEWAIMRPMNDKHINQLEARLESLIEGAFAHLFGRQIRAQDIALQLARAMEDNLRQGTGDDRRPLAPDHYRIIMNPTAHKILVKRRPDLLTALSGHLVDLATRTGYRLDNPPVVEFETDDSLPDGRVRVVANHIHHSASSTGIMEPVTLPESTRMPVNAQVALEKQIILLQEPLLNVGRHLSNQIVIDDPHISRHHAQIRLRFGRYTIFDVQSRTGTFVNDVMVKSHELQSGDVIRVGNTRLIYFDDEDDTTAYNLPAVPRDEDHS
ncbi:MAG: DUF3662 and FHA domain-containing protein [Chloroflexota bacterium]